MANARIGSNPSYGYQLVESIDTTAKQLVRSDSGKVIVNASVATRNTFPLSL